MKLIYSSKLYKASNHKDKIRAHISDPINAELIKQLSEYVDIDSLPEEVRNNEPNSSRPNDESEDSAESNKIRPSKSRSGGGSGPAPSGKSLSDKMVDLDNKLGDDNEDMPEPPELEASPEVAESRKVSGRGITASEGCCSRLKDSDLDALKGTLNSRSDTAGVIRSVVKDDELWIYYNDKVNLNNVMELVIEIVTKLYTFVEFNRLARSDNAIVFDVYRASSLATEDEK